MNCASYFFGFVFLLLTASSIRAQTQLPSLSTLPKQTLNKPQPNTQPLQLNSVIVGRWRGARLNYATNGTVTVDSLWIEFLVDGTFGFKHQNYGGSGPTSGTYTLTRTAVQLAAEKFPFTHAFNGNFNTTSGIITGTFRENRQVDASQPPYYTPGVFTGEFNLTRY